jgi:hypothetical protein
MSHPRAPLPQSSVASPISTRVHNVGIFTRCATTSSLRPDWHPCLALLRHSTIPPPHEPSRLRQLAIAVVSTERWEHLHLHAVASQASPCLDCYTSFRVGLTERLVEPRVPGTSLLLIVVTAPHF